LPRNFEGDAKSKELTMATITIPPDNTQPITLQSGDTLTVNSGGTSKSITINDGATEFVNTGGKAVNTTVNDGGRLEVNGGAIDQTTLNGGGVILHHATADHATINFSLAFPFSQLEAHDHSVVKNIVITGGALFGTTRGALFDATSTVENVTFRDPSGKGAAGLGLDNPQNVTGFIKGLGVGDFIQLGGQTMSIEVTGFELDTKKNDLIITYNDATHTGLHATYHVPAMQPHTTFALTQGTVGTNHSSTLTVIAEKTVGQHDAAFESASSTDLVSLVGVAHGHGHAGDALL
jgi:autotransporter passenger strand-loop-strand repeat protein